MANKNYMQEVAAILGVELGEVFYVNKEPSFKYHLNATGLHCDKKTDWMCMATLTELLVGYTTIVRQPWKPGFRETYYLVAKTGVVISQVWYEHSLDLMAHKLGNCYRTKEEAEVNRGKWIAFYASDEMLEV